VSSEISSRATSQRERKLRAKKRTPR
jgi:hypothetical protein